MRGRMAWRCLTRRAILDPSLLPTMPGNLAALRLQVETALAGRVAAPFAYRDRKLVEMVSAGVPEIDALTGGLPRGGLTEICGPPCSGRTSLLVSALASRTAQAEVCALVDGRDAFDPHAAAAAGVELKQLLWVRCRNIEQALRSTDLLLQGGGFGMIAVDLSDILPATVRHVPLNAWFRFRRAVEDTPTILMLIEQEPNAKTCASLVLRVGFEGARWVGAARENRVREFCCANSSACLLGGVGVRAEVVRSSVQPIGGGAVGVDGSVGVFETEAMGKAGDFFETAKECKCNFKFKISDFK
jgi:recombination protein RecA